MKQKTRDSQPERPFLCSELVTLSAGRKCVIGNLEEIAPRHCSVLLDVPIAAGMPVQLECLDCPRKNRGLACWNCRFAGNIEGQERDAKLGLVTRIGFQGRLWSKDKWHPRHLTDPDAV